MLRNTFRHIHGIGEQTERALWDAGVTSWNCTVPLTRIKLPPAIRDSWSHHMRESLDNHASGNLGYFADNLPAGQRWRLYHDFQNACAFLDIETTGLSIFDDITTAVLYDARSVRYFVKGENLQEFPRAVQDYPLLVTYNGNGFDIPRIERFFRIRLAQAHIDLMHPLRSLGLKGGLKACEAQLGIGRPGVERVDGFVAVLLWNEYQKRNNLKALETLLAYNIQDTVALHSLMVHTHNEKIKATPFSASYALPPPSPPGLLFQADHDTVERLRRQAFGSIAISPT